MHSLAAAEPVPSPLWLITLLHVLTLFLHWAAMNVLVGSAFHLATTKPSQVTIQRRMAAAIPPVFSITVTLGVAPLLFLQLVHGERFYSSSIYMAWPWLLSLLVLMVGYYAAYAGDARLSKGRDAPAWMRWSLLISLAVFSFVLAANVALSERPAVMEGLTETGWNLAVMQTGVISRWFHELLGAVALGSLYLLVVGYRERTEDEAAGAGMMKRAANVAILMTAIGMLGGICTLIKDPKAVGGAAPGASLGMGILFGFATVGHMWLAAYKKPTRKLVTMAVIFGAVTLVCKAILRISMRDKRLADIPAPETATDVGPVVFFAVCLVIAVSVTGWLIRTAMSARDPDGRT